MLSLYNSSKIAMSPNLQISLTNDSVKYIPFSFHEYGLFLKKSKQGGLRIYILFEKTPWNFWNLSLYSEKTGFHPCKFYRIVWHSFRFSTHCFSKVPCLSLTVWNSRSLIFPDSFLSLNYKVYTFFRSLNSRS